MSLLEKLEKKENFTSAESSLADYIINNTDAVYGMSLQELAKVSYVSKPSVIRLYRKLGYKSYREFSITLQLEKIRFEDEQPIENTKVFADAKSLYEFAERIGAMSKQIVDNCIAAIDRDNLEDIVYSIKDAERVFLFSDGVMSTDTAVLHDRLLDLGLDVCLFDESTASRKLVSTLNENDAVLIISSGNFSEGKEKQLLDMIINAPALKIMITTYDDHTLSEKMDYLFYTYPHGNDFIRTYSLVSQMSLLLGMNIIYSCIRKIINEEKQKGQELNVEVSA